MKKIKFVGLPILALTAIAGLTSCNGGGTPKQKPGVIFHASAMVRKFDTDKGIVVDKSIDFKDKECAKVTITNEDKLQYGKQDVEIFIEPKDDFFSFRKYDIESWAAVDRDTQKPYLPSRPYVGLGSPVSLYNYPLQENVAWTFTDLSEQIKDKQGDPTGFYKEKYKITVKKEYFQKNIVIDYGNVETLDNSVYVYNSDSYSQKFESTPVTGDFGKYYKNDPSVSSYAAASPGATVTYTFVNSDHGAIFTFDGWDDVPTQSANSNADEKIPYEHFEIYGLKADHTKENIAKYDPSKTREEQPFIPTVMTKDKVEYLSFFIKWDLLAEGKETGFKEKYSGIEVEIGEPTPDYTPNEIVTSDGIKVYPGGLFQYVDSGKKIPIDDSSEDYITYDSSTQKQLTFYNVYDEQEGNHYSFYSVLFELPDDDELKNSFAVTINGKKIFDVDLLYGQNQKTTWRELQEVLPEGEKDLYWWFYAGWHLVQLNPEGRTYGLPSDEFVGKSNLYFLYSNSFSPMDGRALDINIELVKSQTATFELSSTEYGEFIVEGKTDVKTVTLPCGNKSTINIPFKSKVIGTLEIKVTAAGRTDLVAEIIKDKVSGGTALHVYSKTATAFGDGITCTIDLSLPATKVKIRDDAKELGQLLDESGQQLVDEYNPTIVEGTTTKLTFTFKLKEGYTADVAKKIVENKGINVYSNNIQLDAKSEASTSEPSITIEISDTEVIKKEGFIFEISVKYVDYTYSDNLSQLGIVGLEKSELNVGPLYEAICAPTDNIHLQIIATSPTTPLTDYVMKSATIKSMKYQGVIEFGEATAKGGFVQGKEANTYVIDIIVPITSMGGLKTIPNGLDLAIGIEFAAAE